MKNTTKKRIRVEIIRVPYIWRAHGMVNGFLARVAEEGFEIIDVRYCGGSFWTSYNFMILYR